MFWQVNSDVFFEVLEWICLGLSQHDKEFNTVSLWARWTCKHIAEWITNYSDGDCWLRDNVLMLEFQLKKNNSNILKHVYDHIIGHPLTFRI